MADQRAHQARIGNAVAAESSHRFVDRTAQRCRRAIEGMSEGNLRVDVLEAVALQRQGAKERRPHCQRMNGRTDVMGEAGQRQLRRARAAADRVLGFEDGHRLASLSEPDRRRQSVRTRPDHHGINPWFSQGR